MLVRIVALAAVDAPPMSYLANTGAAMDAGVTRADYGVVRGGTMMRTTTRVPSDTWQHSYPDVGYVNLNVQTQSHA
jgi:hypothetical protein